MTALSNFSVGLGALLNAQAALDTTSHNIANAATPGYSRQRVNLQANTPIKFGASGYVGTGAVLENVQRLSSTLLKAQVDSAASSNARNTTYSNNIGQLESLMADLSNNVSNSLGTFFAAANGLAATPQSAGSRAAFMDAASGVMAKYQEVSGHLSELTTSVNQTLTSTVSDINMYADELAKINASPNNGASDVLDKQDQIVSQLSEKLGVRSIRNAEGQLSVFMANGQPLVLADKAFRLNTIKSTDNPDSLDIGIDNGAGSSFKLNEKVFGGGEITGLLEFRKQTLVAARDTIGRAALAFAGAVNQQNNLGQTSDGVEGTNIFAIGTPPVFSGLANSGTALLTASISDTSAIQATDYTIKYTAAGYQITRGSDGTQTTFAALPATLDGVQLAVGSGAPAVGDTFTLAPARTAASDMRLNITDGKQIASGIPVLATPDATNKGVAQVTSISATSSPWAPNIKNPVTVAFTAPGTFTMNGNPPDSVTATTNGWEMTYNGWKLELAGTPSNGDKIDIAPAGLNGDGRNAGEIAALQNAKIVGGQSTPAGSYASLMADIGSQTRVAESAASASGTILQQTTTNRDEVSGVNLDEEAANLVKWQKMYQAATKMIQTSNNMFDAIIAINH